MVYSFILPEETITNFQEKIEFLEKCLNNANPQDEIFAEIIELENSGLISINKLIEEVKNLQYKLNKLLCLLRH
jgi:Ca2+-binding EF-hand superfamily protein